MEDGEEGGVRIFGAMDVRGRWTVARLRTHFLSGEGSWCDTGGRLDGWRDVGCVRVVCKFANPDVNIEVAHWTCAAAAREFAFQGQVVQR